MFPESLQDQESSLRVFLNTEAVLPISDIRTHHQRYLGFLDLHFLDLGIILSTPE